MKRKLFSIFMILAFAIVLVACKDDEFDSEAEQDAFDEMVLLVDISVPTGNRGSVVNSFSVPVELAGEATVTWSSDKEAYAIFSVTNNQNLIVITRPAEGEDDEVVVLTATVTWTGLSGTEYTDSVDFTIKVLAMPVAEVVTIADVRNGEVAVDSDVKFEDVVVISVVGNGITVFDPTEKHAIFVYGSAIASVSTIGDRGEIVGKYTVNFDAPQLKEATLTKVSSMDFEDLLELATEVDVADFWLEPGSSSAVVLEAKQDPARNTFVKFTGNVKDHPEWASGSSTNYTTVFHDPLDEDKYVRSYYGSPRHNEIKLLDGIDDVTVYAVAYTVRDDRVKPSTIIGILPSYELFVIHYTADISDEKAVELDKAALTIETTFKVSGTITLPTTGLNGTTITWASDDETTVNSTTGAVVAIPGESIQVVLTATITKNVATDTKVFTLSVGELAITTIAALNALTDGAEVRIQGTIIAFQTSDRYGNSAVYIQDATGMTLLNRVSSAQTTLLVVGQEYEVVGVLATYQDVKQINSATLTKTDAAVVAPTPTVLTRALTEADIYTYVTVTGFVKADATGRGIKIYNEDIEYALYMSSSDDLSATVYDEILSKFAAGNKVEITGIVGHYNLNPQMLILSSDVVTVLPEDLVGLAATLVNHVTEPNATVTSNLNLTTEIFGATFAWVSDNAAVIENDGTVIRPAAGQADAVVTLTFTASVGATALTIANNTVQFTVIAQVDAPAGTTYIETFVNSNATASYTTSSFVGNYGITWSYVASRNENGDANNSGIDGNALMLRRSSDTSSITSSTISGGISYFEVKLYKGFTGGGNRQVEVFINGVSIGTSTPFDDFNEHIFIIENINITGDFTIEIRNITGTQIIIDDITWTDISE